MSTPMDLLAFCLLLAISTGFPLALLAKSTRSISSRITVVGAVYCNTCQNSGFSRHSYFIPGADVHIQCKFNANSPKTAEMITFSVNRTTDVYGVYKLEIPSVDGVDCVDGPPIQSFCQASLLGSSSSACDVPSLKATTTEISVKSKQENLCVYSFTPLSFRPRRRNGTLCRKRAEEASNTPTSSESLLSQESPLPAKQTSSIPQAANLQSLPFPFPFSSPPPLFPFPFPFASAPPSLPFPFSSPPPSFPIPFPFLSPPPSSFPFPNLPKPPSIPSLFPSPPPPPSFNLGDPTTWIPHIPLISPSPPPPPPPAFDLRDPKTWTPIIPPFSPPSPQKQNP